MSNYKYFPFIKLNANAVAEALKLNSQIRLLSQLKMTFPTQKETTKLLVFQPPLLLG